MLSSTKGKKKKITESSLIYPTECGMWIQRDLVYSMMIKNLAVGIGRRKIDCPRNSARKMKKAGNENQ